MGQILLVFSTTHDTLKAEQVLEAGGIDHRPMPVPRTIKAGCGLGVALSDELLSAALICLGEEGLEVRAWKLIPGMPPVACDC